MIRSPIQRHDLYKPLDELFAPQPIQTRRKTLSQLLGEYAVGLLIGGILIAIIAGIATS